MINNLICELIAYGIKNELIDPSDEIYCINSLLDLFGLDGYSVPDDSVMTGRPLCEILEDMLQFAIDHGLVEDTSAQRDLFDTRIMGRITPAPSIVQQRFAEDYRFSPRSATDNYYEFCKATNYIRTDRIAKDERWVTDTEYGAIDISINLSKPEKDPRDIAKAGQTKSSGYPACLLCRENEGYAGNLSHPARQNHRVIPVVLGGETYYLQYSPYVYYNEHCIVFNKKHIPMRIDRSTFEKLFDFVDLFPHYTIGSNADLPIVGGSILSHDHFQGGCVTFPMARAEMEERFSLKAYPNITAGIVKWPMSVIRLQSEDENALIDASEEILTKWRGYTDADACIFAETDGVAHNTITPIVRTRGELYEIDLVLRNNITTEECPMGLYHPHNEYHHIKKENIGLIEVQGLAILPARLKTELAALKEAILEHRDLREDEILRTHADWVDKWIGRYTELEKRITDPEQRSAGLDEIVRDEVGHYFVEILACSGVYKRDPQGKEAFRKFIAYCDQ